MKRPSTITQKKKEWPGQNEGKSDQKEHITRKTNTQEQGGLAVCSREKKRKKGLMETGKLLVERFNMSSKRGKGVNCR